MQTRLFAYKKQISTTRSAFKDSVPVPSDVRRIIKVCAYIDNGTNHDCRGFLSLNNENTNEQLVSTLRIANDKRHINKKFVEINCVPQGGNVNFVLNYENMDTRQRCYLGILFLYEL